MPVVSGHNQQTFCPYQLVSNYIAQRPHTVSEVEQFFVYSDRTPVTLVQIRNVLRLLIARTGLEANLYNVHSLRIGRCVDLLT